MKSRAGSGKTAINPKWNLNLVKKSISRKVAPSTFGRVYGGGSEREETGVDIIVRKLSFIDLSSAVLSE